jgi:outer membrane protein assembly factor BamB
MIVIHALLVSLAAFPTLTQDEKPATHAAHAAWMAEAEAGDSVHWPAFRGWRAGVSEGKPRAGRVQHRDEVSTVRWRTPIPGPRSPGPIVWGDRVFVTTAVKEGEAELKVGLYGDITSVENEGSHKFQVLCIDKKTGKVLWTQTAIEAVPKIMRHTKSSHAASTPATDGEHVVAFFGSEGLYCFDFAGKLLWKKDFGLLDSGYYVVPASQWGFASSPVIWDRLVIVQCDVQKDSFVAALDVTSGKELWRVARDEVPTWCTPSVFEIEGKESLVLNGWKHIGGYDPRSGAELWKTKGGGDVPVPTPVQGEGLVFLTSSHGMFPIVRAVRLGAEGEIGNKPEEDPDLAWKLDRRGNYMQTPLYHAGLLYCCNDDGVLTCVQASDGKEVYRERLGGGTTGFTASGVACGDKLYFTSEEGEVYTVKAGPEFELLGENVLGETCMSTPAISDGVLLFRARSHLVAISED